MAVEVLGVQGEVDGYGDSMGAFRNANDSNSKVLLNIADGKVGKNRHDPRPPHDHNHPDNQWPVWMHSPGGDKLFGKSVKGIDDPRVRQRVIAANEAAVEEAKKTGFRMEPYPKPQIAVLDPAAEKAAQEAKTRDLEAKLVAAHDLINKFTERLTALEKGK